jgi:hypothetical protein
MLIMIVIGVDLATSRLRGTMIVTLIVQIMILNFKDISNIIFLIIIFTLVKNSILNLSFGDPKNI